MADDDARSVQESPRPWKPIPDPTDLTTEALDREIKNLKEILLRELGHVGDLSGEKFRGVEAKFDGVDEKFLDVARRTAEQKTDTKDALDAALQAAKDAVSLQTEASDKAIAKSEAATTKQIDALAVLLNASDERRGADINDLKVRLTALETTRQNTVEVKSDNRGAVLMIAAVVASLISMLGLFAAVAAVVVNIAK